MLLYFTDVWSDLVSEAISFLQTPALLSFIAGFLFIAFLALSALFYIGALAVYVYEIWVSLWHEHHERTRKWQHKTYTPVRSS
jgi:predicted membrane protein